MCSVDGAGHDPATKQCMMYATERDAMVRLDAYRACVSRRTGIPQRTIPVREKWSNTPGWRLVIGGSDTANANRANECPELPRPMQILGRSRPAKTQSTSLMPSS